MNVNFLNFKAGTSYFAKSLSNNSVNYQQYPSEQALQMYMQTNNCDEATAKSALEKMYGAPAQQGVQGRTTSAGINGNSLNGSTNGVVKFNQGNNPKQDFDNQLILLGIPQDVVMTHNQNKIKEYADENNIQLPNPPQQGQKLDFMG